MLLYTSIHILIITRCTVVTEINEFEDALAKGVRFKRASVSINLFYRYHKNTLIYIYTVSHGIGESFAIADLFSGKQK